ncbi:hypothetical protein AGIG_G10995 [Arapaima gigas]
MRRTERESPKTIATGLRNRDAGSGFPAPGREEPLRPPRTPRRAGKRARRHTISGSLDLAAPQGERRYPEPQVPIDTPHLNPDLQELTNSQPRACCLERGTKDVEAARISKTVSRSYLEGIYTVVWVQGQAVCWRGELRCSVLALLNLRITMKTGITSVDDTPNSLLGLDLPTSRRQVIKRIPAGATLPFVSKASFSFSQLKSQHRVGGHGLSVHLYVRVYTKGS